MEETAKVPVYKASVIYGVLVGLVSGVVGLVLYFIDQSLESWAVIFTPILYVALIVISLILFRREYGKGYARYGQLVLVSFITGIAAAIITSSFTFIIYQMDESYIQDTKYFAIEKMDKQFEKMEARYQEKLPADQYDTFEERMKDQRKKQVNKIENKSTFSFAFGGVFSLIIISVLTGLIAAIFIKKDPEAVL
ncbi:MAG: DUF4199 domain-containing protein [Bacteroidales bacterium]|nr:DUF4199 domain-containing protein [Bacteroidales bacterium]